MLPHGSEREPARRQSGGGILICDLSGRILDADPPAAALTGYTPQELLSRSILELADTPGAGEARCWLERIQTGGTVAIRTGLRRKDGSVHSVDVRLSRARTAGDFRAIVELRGRRRASDRLPEELGFVRAIMDAAGYFILVFDGERRIVLLNKACLDLLGRSFEEVRGKVYPDVFQRKDASSEDPLERASLEEPTDGETEWVGRDGRSHRIAWSLRPIREGNESRGYTVLTGTDVTDFRDLVRTRSSEAALIQSCGEALYTKTLDGTVTSWNRAAEELFGYPAAEIVGRSVLPLVPPDRRSELAQVLERIKRGESVRRFETVRVHKDGSPLEVLSTLSPIRDAQGTVFAAAVVARDISARRRVEEALRASEARLRHLLEELPLALWTTDLNLGVTYSGGRLYGQGPVLEASAYLGEHLAKLFPSNHPALLAHREAAQGRAGRFLIESDDRAFEAVVEPLRDAESRIIGTVGAAMDVTDQRQVEKALRSGEERLERAEEIARAGSWEWEVASGQVTWSPGLFRLYGVDPGEFQPSLESYIGLVHPEDRDRVLENITRSVQGGTPFSSECRVIRPDGAELLVWSRGEVVRDSEGRTVRLVGICHDVTERKRAEEALREREERLALTIEAADIGTWDWDPRTGDLQCSRRCKELFGLPEDARVDMQIWARAIHPDDRERILGLVEWVGKPESGGAYDTEYRTVGLAADPVERWVRAQGRIYYDAKGVARRGLGTVIDVTERKRFEQDTKDLTVSLERRVAERTAELEGALHEMEAFTYAVAHDLRAPLRALHGLSDILLADYTDRPLDEDGSGYLLKIREASLRMDVLIQDILGYARLRKEDLPRLPVDLAPLASGVLAHMADDVRSLGATVRLEGGPATAVANPVLLTQAFQNLISNALKFVPPGAKPDVRVKIEPRDYTVVLSVEDNGIGIAPEHYERIFGVFQRLNLLEEYPGTGIGLAIVRRAVERMGGRVGVRSEPGKGSTFWIELPKAT